MAYPKIEAGITIKAPDQYLLELRSVKEPFTPVDDNTLSHLAEEALNALTRTYNDTKA